MIIGHITVVTICYFAFYLAKAVPDGWATAIGVGSALDLIAGGRSPPEEAAGKSVYFYTNPYRVSSLKELINPSSRS